MGMEEFLFDPMELIRSPSIAETFADILLFAVPIWAAAVIGLVIGWSWRPRWTGLIFLGLRSRLRFLWTLPPGLGARRLWFAFTAFSAFSVGRRLWSTSRIKEKLVLPLSNEPMASSLSATKVENDGSCSTRLIVEELVTELDLERLRGLLGEEGMQWKEVMQRVTPHFSYRAWCRQTEGPLLYRSRTVFKDVTPDLVRDFFWDDDFRPKWDPMLAHSRVLDRCARTGTHVVHWIRKFPFFCSDREYVIGRRIWEADDDTFYCVTKAVLRPCPVLERRRQGRPRRVDDYFSSWIIRPVRSSGDEAISCEVDLVHCEDMGIPKDVARLGVRHAMWGTVKKLHSGLRAYQGARLASPARSEYALMGAVTTRISPCSTDGGASRGEPRVRRPRLALDWRWIVVVGVTALVFGARAGIVSRRRRRVSFK